MHTEADLAAAGKQAIEETISTLAALGRAELETAVLQLEQWAVPAARWVIEKQTAKAAGDAAKVDELDRNFELLTANATFALAEAGVLAQSEGERVLGNVLAMVGKFAVAAVIAI